MTAKRVFGIIFLVASGVLGTMAIYMGIIDIILAANKDKINSGDANAGILVLLTMSLSLLIGALIFLFFGLRMVKRRPPKG